MSLTLAIAALMSSALPAAMFLKNLPLFRIDLAAGSDGSESDIDANTTGVSLLIPARDEALGIRQSVTAALASVGVELEVVVLDDCSTDGTAEIVSQLCRDDQRVRLLHGTELPDGWNGKQHACKLLADAARFDNLVFIDADVRLQPHAIAWLIARMQDTDVALLSAFPRQVTETWLEKWVIPMMHFILLGYLPLDQMRQSTKPPFAAGCGQLFVTNKRDYQRAGTHAAIRESRHDGVKLPRAYRNADMMTDVVDGTQLASCRMYDGAGQVVRGVLKNAVEGIANPKLIVVFTMLLLGCSLLPVVALAVATLQHSTIAIAISGAAIVLAHLPRLIACRVLQQSWLGAFCHVPATVLFVTLQWIALINHVTGRKIAWRGRTQT
ncbi:glycosyltransferase [Stieleria varia]|uniref:4,4'-diaponeurosporenoate glycosyltransferase n=1 Tax=Stieleria varia TaxID=2528005 RepID=A0A5C6B3U7_9BACT|nr:glycosyltransferase family 2 protein [Stieleria varia]TWU05999.1 4,4'-diaponeurosporenoate glycosyltransferase [Stieleria varia]